MTETFQITISLDFMERDTVLACLKDLAEMKTLHAKSALTREEMVIANAQAETAMKLYNKIYEQKKKEFENGF